MRRLLFVFSLLVACMPLAAQTPAAARLWVAPLSGPDAALNKHVRDALVDQLSHRGLRLVESREVADVYVTASGLMQSARPTRIGRHPQLHVHALVTLSRSSGTPLWSHEVSSGRLALNQTDSFIDAATDGILNAVRQSGFMPLSAQ